MKVVKWCWHKIKGMFSWYVHLFKGRRWYVKLLSGFISFVLFLIVYFGMVDINFLGLFWSLLVLSGQEKESLGNTNFYE